eukprot:Hpha_TRINITY_DN15327_c6_g1::TRINITY_DN15327_c6_g1_i4::g.91096::m.91096
MLKVWVARQGDSSEDAFKFAMEADSDVSDLIQRCVTSFMFPKGDGGKEEALRASQVQICGASGTVFSNRKPLAEVLKEEDTLIIRPRPVAAILPPRPDPGKQAGGQGSSTRAAPSASSSGVSGCRPLATAGGVFRAPEAPLPSTRSCSSLGSAGPALAAAVASAIRPKPSEGGPKPLLSPPHTALREPQKPPPVAATPLKQAATRRPSDPSRPDQQRLRVLRSQTIGKEERSRQTLEQEQMTCRRGLRSEMQLALAKRQKEKQKEADRSARLNAFSRSNTLQQSRPVAPVQATPTRTPFSRSTTHAPPGGSAAVRSVSAAVTPERSPPPRPSSSAADARGSAKVRSATTRPKPGAKESAATRAAARAPAGRSSAATERSPPAGTADEPSPPRTKRQTPAPGPAAAPAPAPAPEPAPAPAPAPASGHALATPVRSSVGRSDASEATTGRSCGSSSSQRSHSSTTDPGRPSGPPRRPEATAAAESAESVKAAAEKVAAEKAAAEKAAAEEAAAEKAAAAEQEAAEAAAAAEKAAAEKAAAEKAA